MRTDTVILRYSFTKTFTVTYPDHSEWKRQNIQRLSKGPVWYTDGSKTNFDTSGGILGGKTGLMASISKSIARDYNGRTFTIFTDSQAALKALESLTLISKLVLECLGCLNELATQNSAQLV